MSIDASELQSLSKAAEQGSAEAAEMLMECSESTNKQLYYATLAVKNGSESPCALALAGAAYFQGTPTIKQDYEKARACFEANMASSEPSYSAAGILGCMYFEGMGGVNDYEKGESCLRFAMGSDDEEEAWNATAELGNYLFEKVCKRTEGMNLLKSAADAGHIDAQINLGKAYYFMGVDTEKGRHYYELAAQQGSEIAKNKLQALAYNEQKHKRLMIGLVIGAVVLLNILLMAVSK